MVFQSLFTGERVIIDLPNNEDLPLMRYSVLLSRGKEHYMGYVISHLSIIDWCKLNKYKLDHLYPVTRKAVSTDTTNLRSIGDK